jgi:hypothetical protein
MNWFVLYEIVSGDFEGVGGGEVERKQRGECSIGVVSVEVLPRSLHYATRRAERRRGRKGRVAPVGMTELVGEGDGLGVSVIGIGIGVGVVGGRFDCGS